MRVGILTLFSKDHMDGISQYTIQLVRHLLKMSKDDEFVLFHTGDPLHFKDGDRLKNVRIKPLTNLLMDSFHRNIKIRKLGADLDILHGPFHGVPFGPFKRIITMCDVMPLVEESHPPLQVFQFKAVVPLMLKTVDRVIAISEKTRQDLLKHYTVDETKVTTILLGVETTSVPKDEQPAHLEGLGVKGPYILMVSNLEPIKNVTGLVKAFARIAKKVPHDLVLAGKRPEYPEPYDEARKAGIKDRVIFTDRVSDEALAALYTNADFYVLSSFSEGYGYTVVEAMAYGTPVTCSRAGALPEVAGDAAHYFDPKDVDDMASALERMANDADLRAELRRRGAKRAKLYSHDEMARRTLRVYREVLDS